jgi:hypothetical protein
MVSWLVCLGVGPTLGAYDQTLPDSKVEHPLRWEDGPVMCTAVSLWCRSPILCCLIGHWPSCITRHWVPFLSLLMTCRDYGGPHRRPCILCQTMFTAPLLALSTTSVYFFIPSLAFTSQYVLMSAACHIARASLGNSLRVPLGPSELLWLCYSVSP